MRTGELLREAPVGGQDVARWVTFSSFWGVLYFLIACVSMVATARRQPVRLHGPTAALAMLIHVAGFVLGGSTLSALGSLVRGKSSTEQAKESISSGQLEATVPLQALGGAAGAVVPFALTLGSLTVAEQITGQPAMSHAGVRWLPAIGVMTGASGLAALAVGRIAAWVAEDAKSRAR